MRGGATAAEKLDPAGREDCLSTDPDPAPAEESVAPSARRRKSPPGGRSGRRASDRFQELRVALELVQRLDEPLHRFHRLQREQRAAQLLHLLVFVLAEELLFLARAAGL